MLVLLLASFVTGLSDLVVLTNTMAVQMSQTAADADMAGMACERGAPAKPCDLAMAHCGTGCALPGVLVPIAMVVPAAVDTARRPEASGPELRSGLDGAPGLPPPRSRYIA